MAVTFDVSGEQFELTQEQATDLAEKLRLFAKGNYPKDIELLAARGAPEDWRDGALAVADFIEARLAAESAEPLPLEGKAAEAVYQKLRITYMDATERQGVARLLDALAELLKPSRA